MDCQDYSTVSAERKKGQHLGMAERGAIKALKQQGFGTRAIAREIGCVPSTITNELRRGTPARKSSKGKSPGYSPKLGQAVYEANRAACHRKPKADSCRDFSEWVIRQVREHKWSLDACCGYAKLHHLFEPSQMVCSRTLYNMVWNGQLPIHPTELPEALKRKTKKRRVRENKKRYGTSISERPEIASLRLEEGHWEGDTVVGKRAGKESVVFSLLEKKTETYLAFRIPGKTSEAVMNLMNELHDEYGEHFSQIFKTITVDNGSEFADFAKVEKWGTNAFFAHPYTAGRAPKTSATTACFGLLSPRGHLLNSTPTRISSLLPTSSTDIPEGNLGTTPRRSSLKRFWMLSTQPDGCGTLAPGQSLRLHPRPRLSTMGCPTCYCNLRLFML